MTSELRFFNSQRTLWKKFIEATIGWCYGMQNSEQPILTIALNRLSFRLGFNPRLKSVLRLSKLYYCINYINFTSSFQNLQFLNY